MHVPFNNPFGITKAFIITVWVLEAYGILFHSKIAKEILVKPGKMACREFVLSHEVPRALLGFAILFLFIIISYVEKINKIRKK